MKRYLLLIALITFSVQVALSQDLYMPRNVKAAYASKSRTMDGKPGPNYYQNTSKHDIRVSVSPPDRTVRGEETIVYENNSPVPLAAIVFRFDMNVSAPGAPRDKPVSENFLAPPISIDDFSIDGQKTAWDPKVPFKAITFNYILLPKPLAPGGTITFGFKWHHELSEEAGRSGAVEKSSFYLAYFYPRVAVFDPANDWDQIQHMLSHEFYGEFNDYSVEVTVPKNFVVWGTGDLTNIDEVLQPEYAKRLKKSFTSDQITTIATPEELKAGRVTAQTPTVTWKWKADYVPDVAYGLSDQYKWDASSMVVDKKTGRRASTQAAYNVEAKNFANMVDYIKKALDYSSNELPGVPYPYSKMTIFRGGADMEYPMMANDSAQEDPNMQRFIAAHEILHTYFPFYMGINERRYSFMEEGWTTAFELPFNEKYFGRDEARELFRNMRVKGWATSLNPGADIPIAYAEDSIIGEAYGNNKYGRAAIGYLALRDLLGEKEFKRSLHVFMDRWHGKHPIPWDMFYSFNDATGKNLNWFWNAWFLSPGYIDLAIDGVKRNGNMDDVTIKNIGGFPAPVDVVVTYEDGSTKRYHQTPAIWEDDMKSATVKIPAPLGIEAIRLDGGIWMDSNPKDNTWGEQ